MGKWVPYHISHCGHHLWMVPLYPLKHMSGVFLKQQVTGDGRGGVGSNLQKCHKADRSRERARRSPLPSQQLTVSFRASEEPPSSLFPSTFTVSFPSSSSNLIQVAAELSKHHEGKATDVDQRPFKHCTAPSFPHFK